MSIEIMSRVWSQSQQQGTKLVLLLALADMANSNGYCWPSLETLQQKARLSHRQNVIRAIADMEADAEVWVEHGRGRNHSNNYIITVGMGADELAKTLITHFDYSPTDATQKANAFVKRSPPTTLLKCSPPTQNVVEEAHFNEQNVARTRVKRSPPTTRSVIEPINNNDDDSASSTNQVEQSSYHHHPASLNGTPLVEPKPTNQKAQSGYQPDSDFIKIRVLLEENAFGRVTGIMAAQVNGLLKDYSPAWIEDAIAVCVEKNVRNLKYLSTILANWKRDGRNGKPQPAKKIPPVSDVPDYILRMQQGVGK